MKNYYFVNGVGQSISKSGAISKALEISSLSQCRPLLHTNFLPKESVLLESSQIIPSSDVMDVILVTADGSKGSVISAGIILGDIYRNGKKEKTAVCKKGGEMAEKDLELLLQEELVSLCREFYEEEYELRNIKSFLQSLHVLQDHGSALVGIGFTDKYLPLAKSHPELPPFLGKESSYEMAKYVVVPVLYEYPVRAKKRLAPLAILEASKVMEDYDIETDQQLSRAGIHTAEALVSVEMPHIFVESVQHQAEELLRDGKFPIFLGEDQTVTIGAMKGVKEVVGEFSILHLGSATQLRPSYDGSAYSQACAIKKGLEYAKDVVQVGIRSTSNREKKDLQYDKIFFATDIFGEKDDHWMEDVLEELSESNVYVTLDASVFDPRVMMSKSPEPMGLSYGQVMKLLKMVIRKKKVVGLDFVGLCPQEGEHSSELAAARLVYQFLCYSLTKNEK